MIVPCMSFNFLLLLGVFMCVFTILPVVVHSCRGSAHADPSFESSTNTLASGSLISARACNVASHRHLLRASKLTEDFLDIGELVSY
jgi:hypothetical protein